MKTVPTLCVEDIVTADVINTAITQYRQVKTYETYSMNKANADDIELLLRGLISNVLKKDIRYIGGNFYSHNLPYYPHTDFKIKDANEYNVVVPLHYTDTIPNLIIFDQTYNLDSVTWCLKDPVQYFAVNTGVKGKPADYKISNKTESDIDLEFYNTFLSHHDRSCFYGLSGTAYKFKPGSIIAFDSRHIHCTSTFKGTKLGITLKYKIIN